MTEPFVASGTLASGKTYAIAVGAEGTVAAIRLGDDPNLIVAHGSQTMTLARAEQVAECARAVSRTDDPPGGVS